jgi:hypothetical protein
VDDISMEGNAMTRVLYAHLLLGFG